MSPRGIIYGLHGPDCLELRYIGQTVVPLRTRIVNHVARANCGGSYPVSEWIRSLPGRPVGVVLEADPVGGLDAAERVWIAYAKRMGCQLTNSKLSGTAAPARMVSVETRRKIGLAVTGRKASQATRAKMSATRKGVPKPAGFGGKVRLALQGGTVPLEHRAKISTSVKALWADPDYRARQLASRKRAP